MEQAFQDLLDETDKLCGLRFAGKMVASHIGGSFAFGEPCPYESDLDYWLFLSDRLTDARRCPPVTAAVKPPPHREQAHTPGVSE